MLRANLARSRKEGKDTDTNQSYEIMQTVTFTNGRGFALGHNAAAPSPFVTWQFTETADGQKDYYWGRYFDDLAAAQKNFAKRTDDYKDLFHVEERAEGREQAPLYRYYSTQRPVDLDTFPKPPGNAPVEIINFDKRRLVEAGTMRAWGEVAYLQPLTERQMSDYELRPAPGNPDRETRRSITARLKESVPRQEPPTKAKTNKAYDDR